MKKLVFATLMCAAAMSAKAQVITSETVNNVYEEVINQTDSRFVFNAERDGNGSITALNVYSEEIMSKGAVSLTPEYRYQYAYNADGMLSSRMKYVWRHGDWQSAERYDYTLTGDSYNVEYSRWNNEKTRFDQPLGKMTYWLLPNESVASVACYYRHRDHAPMELEWQASVESQSNTPDYYWAKK